MLITYLSFPALIILPALMAYVYVQNPRAWANRFFALYMLDLAMAAFAMLILSITSIPALAGAAAVTTLVTVMTLNGFFMLALILSIFYPHVLWKWYGLPPFIAIAVLLTIGLIVDGVFGTGLFYVASPKLGTGYIQTTEYLVGRAAPLLFSWLLLPLGVTVLLLVRVLFRAEPRERMPVTFLTLSVLIGSFVTPFLPPNPVWMTAPALFFSFVFAVFVGRYQYLLVGEKGVLMPAQVALKAVFNSAAEGMVICDADGRIGEINPAAERMMGVLADGCLGRLFADALAPFLNRIATAAGQPSLAEAALHCGDRASELLLRLADPDATVLLAAVNPIRDLRGRLQGCLLSLRDVTERERVHEALSVQARMAETIRELSAPIIPVADRVLVLPIVGQVDQERAQGMMREMLQAISRHHAQAILIDITGVPVVDAVVAGHLLKSVQAAGLLGCQGILVGVRAKVAGTLVRLGLNLRDLVTRTSMQDGLEYANLLVRTAAQESAGLRRRAIS